MDWLSSFSVILLIISIGNDVSAAGRKKIRIHIPQKVKHIHHHKKIYITKHVAQPTQFVPQYADSEQYAPGYISDPSAVSQAFTLLPLAEGRKSSNHEQKTTAPNIQPLYRARGHYGPSSPTYITKHVTESKPKRVKVIKISEGKKKRIIKKKKPKRVIIQSSQPVRDDKDNKPTSTYHEEFYSDLNSNQNTIRKVKKPKRVEKYVDGDTEHIHTYSEEHIHQVVYDDMPPGASKPMVPMEMAVHQGVHSPIMHSAVPSSMISSVIPSIPGIHAASPLQIHPMPAYYGGVPGMGSMGTPAHFEYMQYDPKDVTHDHMFHNHGEIIHALIPEKKVPTPSKGTYENQNQDLKINPSFSISDIPSYDGKGSWVNGKTKPSGQSQSYYENFNSQKKPTEPSQYKNPYKTSSNVHSNKYKYTDEIPANSDVHYDDIITDYSKPQSSVKYYGNQKNPKPTKGHKSPSYAYPNSEMYKKPTSLQSLKQQQFHKIAQNKPYSTVPSYSESYTLGHHITINNNYKDVKEPSNLKHYTKIYSTSKPSSTTKPVVESFVVDHHKDLFPSSWRAGSKNKNKKSISTQNISFGGQEHKMVINHGTSESHVAESQIRDSAALPSNIEVVYSPPKEYYVPDNHESSVAMSDASNVNYRVVEAPMMVAEETKAGVVETVQIKEESNTTTPEPHFSTASTTIASVVKTPKVARKIKKKNAEKKQQKPKVSESVRTQTEPTKDVKTTTRGRYKYGDKLQDRFDSEYDQLEFV